ncbi:MAG: hypothetical protein IBJ10_07060 [Phycisphaerales bacterium]|nr:hypothetical protein [Phycisphaerales bacterium]
MPFEPETQGRDAGAGSPRGADRPAAGRRPLRRRLLGEMRIRKKLILLHTCFSLGLAAVLLLLIGWAVRDLVLEAERTEAIVGMEMLVNAGGAEVPARIEGLELGAGTALELGLTPGEADEAVRRAGENVLTETRAGWPRVVRWDSGTGLYYSSAARSLSARAAVWKLYLLLTSALLGVYFLIALMLELFVLPRQVYRPIRRLLDADHAVQAGDREHELIPAPDIPADELGEIMRSRNESIIKLRRQEKALAHALDQLEVVAVELKRKNHLLETARQNLADQDRLASLGMMSAGLAHELNTPLAVLKGQAERLASAPEQGVSPEQAALMVRVVRRLEKLSESLLDFARVRPPQREPVRLRALVDEAWTLVSIDREARSVALVNRVDPDLTLDGDADRLSQVFVNLLRNSADAIVHARGEPAGAGSIAVSVERSVRDGDRWASITVADDGPGIDPEVLPRLFEPFTTTRLDARGTGLGLAVAEGIIREHGGVILARNGAPVGVDPPLASRRTGAVFEIMLPMGEAAPREASARYAGVGPSEQIT